MAICGKCQGHRKIYTEQPSGLRRMEVCPACYGTGEINLVGNEKHYIKLTITDSNGSRRDIAFEPPAVGTDSRMAAALGDGEE